MAVTLVLLSGLLAVATAGDFLQPWAPAGISFDLGILTGKANVPLGAHGVFPALSVPVAPNNYVYPAPLSAKHLLPGTAAVQGFPASAITSKSYVDGVSVGGAGSAAFKAANYPRFLPGQKLAVTTVPKTLGYGKKVVETVPATRALYNKAPGFDAKPRALQTSGLLGVLASGKKVVEEVPITRVLYNKAPGLGVNPRAVQNTVVNAPAFLAAPIALGRLPVAQNFVY